MLQVNFPQRTLAPRVRVLLRRRLRPAAALKAGAVAGAIALLLLQFFAVVVYDESPWKLFRMIAALARGPGVLEPDDEFDAAIVAIGLTLHFALALLYALPLAGLVVDAPRRHAYAVGLAFGIALYFANFYGFTALFPWFAPHRTVDTLVIHALFGLTAAKLYWIFRRTHAR